jgi:hypothetical protein
LLTVNDLFLIPLPTSSARRGKTLYYKSASGKALDLGQISTLDLKTANFKNVKDVYLKTKTANNREINSLFKIYFFYRAYELIDRFQLT